ncbi:MAG: ribitol 2-dehydrogenase [Pseudonocardiales bacterium]|nr:ribitol 2-dehydrogenase [Pseudonocardiales bacterium]
MSVVSDALAGKVAVITGGSSGIGLAVARELSRLGAKVVVSARSADRLGAAVASIPGPAHAVVADITDAGTAESLMDEAEQRFGALDIVVANAGIYLADHVWDNDPDAIDRLVSTNVTGVMRTVRAALSSMVPRGGGDVLVTGSVSGTQAIYWEPVYSASKHALHAFVHGVRRQLVGSGVRIGVIGPGVVLNELWSVSADDDIEDRIAAGTGMRSEDVADAVGYMLTRPRHVTIRDLVILPTNQEI